MRRPSGENCMRSRAAFPNSTVRGMTVGGVALAEAGELARGAGPAACAGPAASRASSATSRAGFRGAGESAGAGASMGTLRVRAFVSRATGLGGPSVVRDDTHPTQPAHHLTIVSQDGDYQRSL